MESGELSRVQSCLSRRSCTRSLPKPSRNQYFLWFQTYFSSLLYSYSQNAHSFWLSFTLSLPFFAVFLSFFSSLSPEAVSVQPVFFWIIRWPWCLTLLRRTCWCRHTPVVHCGHIIQDSCPHEQAQSLFAFIFPEGHCSSGGFAPTSSRMTFENWFCPFFTLIYWFFTSRPSAKADTIVV